MIEQLAAVSSGIESAVRRSQEELIMFVWGGPSLVLLTVLYQVWRACVNGFENTKHNPEEN